MNRAVSGRVVEIGDLRNENGIAGVVVDVGRDGLMACGRNLCFRDVVVRSADDDAALVKMARTALELALEWRQGPHCAFADPSQVYAVLRAEAVRLGVVPGVLGASEKTCTAEAGRGAETI